MKLYRHDKDYCGPEGLGITRWIPRRIAGVDINRCCYRHDQAWDLSLDSGGGFKRADVQFREDIYDSFSAEKKYVLGFVVSWTYFFAVRIRRGWLKLRGKA